MHDLNLVSSYADKAALLLDGQAAGLRHARTKCLRLPNLGPAYRASLSILNHPATGKPVILPDGE